MLKKLLLAAMLATASVTSAFAQGQFQPGYVQGNSTASAGQGSPQPQSAMLDRAFGSTQGNILERGVSGWAAVAPGAVFGPQSANQVYAGPSSGGATNPTFRLLVGADLPVPGASSLGGVQSLTCSSHNWFSSLSTGGVFGCTQPNYADLTSFGTGSLQVISPASNNTGFTNALTVANGGTASNVGTSASVFSSLSAVTNGFIAMSASGGGSPTGAIGTGAGLTGGLNISAGSGLISFLSPVALGTPASGSMLNLASGPASHAVPVDVAGTPTWKVVPDCQDSAGNHINYTQSTDAFSCGLSSNVGGTPPQGRLTLASQTPVMLASQTSQSTLYYDCAAGGSTVPVYNGSTDVALTITGCEVSTAMQSSSTGVLNANGVFDTWAVNVSSALHICVATNGSGGGWASDTAGSSTARGTGYSQLDFTTRSYPTNKNALTHCYEGATDRGSISANQATYLGTILTDAGSAGLVSFTLGTVAANGGASRIGVWNAFNRWPFKTLVADNTGSWTYAPGVANTFREVHASTTFNVTQVFGISADPITASYSGIATPGSVTAGIPGVGFDSTTVFCDTTGYISAGTTAQSTGRCKAIPGVGVHATNALESNTTTTSTTWFGWLSANYGVGLLYEGYY